jgi:flagellar biosynthesis protein FliQ
MNSLGPLSSSLEQAFLLVVIASAIPLGASMLIGTLSSILQAATSIQEQTLSFVPKLFVVAGVLYIFGPWIGQKIVGFSADLLRGIVSLGP